jgi:hypothetical protein
VFVAAATRALPRDTTAFTGRQAELARLAGAVDGLSVNGEVVSIHAIGGMAGIGKTTFAVHDDNPAEAAAHLRCALTICQRLGTPGARRVKEALHQHEL